MPHSPCHQRHSWPWWSYVSLACVPNCAVQSFSCSSPIRLSAFLLHSRGKDRNLFSLFLFKTNSPSPSGFVDREEEKPWPEVALYSWVSRAHMTGTYAQAVLSNGLCEVTDWVRAASRGYALLSASQQHGPFSVGFQMDGFRGYQPSHRVSCVLPSTCTSLHLNFDQVLEQLRLFPSKGRSGRVKVSCFKNLGKEKKLVFDEINPLKKLSYFLLRYYRATMLE